MRVKGVSVFPGYRGSPIETAAAFDNDDYYRIGDAGKLLDDDEPSRGVMFDGRITEDFKLSSGTWVSVGVLRTELISLLSPWVNDIVIAGHDRGFIGILVFAASLAAPDSSAKLRIALRDVMQALRAAGAGSSRLPLRALVLDTAASLEAGEITDKGYINQRAVLRLRASDVDRLYAAEFDPGVVTI
jgi:feruloyl-CoA synthase